MSEATLWDAIQRLNRRTDSSPPMRECDVPVWLGDPAKKPVWWWRQAKSYGLPPYVPSEDAQPTRLTLDEP